VGDGETVDPPSLRCGSIKKHVRIVAGSPACRPLLSGGSGIGKKTVALSAKQAMNCCMLRFSKARKNARVNASMATRSLGFVRIGRTRKRGGRYEKRYHWEDEAFAIHQQDIIMQLITQLRLTLYFNV